MKKKIGDEVLIKAKISEIDEFSDSLVNYRFDIGANCVWGTENTIIEPGMTAEEAWELVKKIYEFTCDELETIFGVKHGFYDVISKFTIQEAKAKLDEWESKQIRVGDVIFCFGDCDDDWKYNEEHYGVVTGIYNSNYQVLMKNGDVNPFKKSSCKKTGKHIDIQSVLDQIGGDEDV